jgi:hypothetical protein
MLRGAPRVLFAVNFNAVGNVIFHRTWIEALDYGLLVLRIPDRLMQSVTNRWRLYRGGLLLNHACMQITSLFFFFINFTYNRVHLYMCTVPLP